MPIWDCDALQEGEECGAFAALAMSLWGVLTALILPLVFAGQIKHEGVINSIFW